jgi:hypothetical protein
MSDDVVLCPFCKLKKKDVNWHFLGRSGCKDCADKHFKSLDWKRLET